MKKEEMIEEVKKISSKANLIKFIENNDLDIEYADDTKFAELKAVVLGVIDDIEDEDDTEGDPDPENEDPEEEDEDDDLTPEQIVKKLIDSDEYECKVYTRTIDYVNAVSMTKKDYELATLTLTKSIETMVAVEDDIEGIVYKPGKDKQVSVIMGSLIATLRNDSFLKRYYNRIKKDSDVLYEWLPEMEVKILTLHLPANTEFRNPFSKRGSVRNYPEDRILKFIYKVTKVPEALEKSIKLEKLLSRGASLPSSLIEKLL